jgi:uncharacterized protein YjdB
MSSQKISDCGQRRKVLLRTVRTTLLIALLTALFFVTSSIAEDDAKSQALTITAPTDGTVVRPGDGLVVRVLTPNPEIHHIVVIGQRPIGWSKDAPGPPFTIPVHIPETISQLGLYKLSAFGDFGTTSQAVTIDVELSGSVATIALEPTSITFQYPGSRVNLRALGTMLAGASLDITRSSKIVYVSDNESVAVVNSLGKVVAVGAGICNITATYEDKKFSVSVSVPAVVRGDLNGDGKVDDVDLAWLRSWVSHPVNGPNDARDLNHDGRIDQKDIEILKQIIEEQNGTAKEEKSGKDKQEDKSK